MIDLSSRYLGLQLRSPLVASASPLTGDLDSLKRLQSAGVGAVVLPSLFEEQVVHEALETSRLPATGAAIFPEALDYFPELEDYNTGPDRYLKLIEDAKAWLSIPVIASLNGASRGGWVRYARMMQDAGADALELNIYFLATDPDQTASTVELQYVDLVSDVRGQVDIPLAVKIGPYFNAAAHMAKLLVRAGADGLVLFNRFYQPDIDLDEMKVVPHLVLSDSEELRLPLRWIAILYRRVAASLAATTGIHEPEDVVKVIAAGADIAMTTSALLRHGPEYLRVLEAGVVSWLGEHEYASVDELRGCMSQANVPDPAQFERANYMRTLTTYTSGFRF